MKEKYEILTDSRFYLELTLEGSQELIDGYFKECSGFKRSQDVIEICEVTPQKWGKNGTKMGRVVRTKIPGNTKCENIVLHFGLTISMTMWKWFEAVEHGKWGEQRRDGDLTLYDQGGTERARFRFVGAWPISYKISDVKAEGKDFEIEQLELAVDEFTRIK
ncbi:MAG TPA: phage tail protein [Coleofasciculaceae cyanobacterium]